MSLSASQRQKLTMVVPVRFGDINVRATLDTGSQATIVNDDIFAQIPNPPKETEIVYLRGVSKDIRIQAKVVPNLTMWLGEHKFTADVFVAPIVDQMLLGLDFLNANIHQIDLQRSSLFFGDKEVPYVLKSDSDTPPAVCKVVVAKRITLRPNTVTCIRCEIRGSSIPKDSGTMIYSSESYKGSSVPPTFVRVQDDMHVPMFNESDQMVMLSQGQVIALAEEAIECESSVDLRSVSVSESETIPEHVKKLYEHSSASLAESERTQLAELLTEFQDVFARNDQDIGCLSNVKHRIDTGFAAPIKQGMRRTPLGFEGEEEKHLESMMAHDIVRPSQSDWASPPVLVRKRDGSVRWCVDFRKLNNVTVKDLWPLPRIDACIDTLSGSKLYSCLDMCSGYWQIEIAEKDKPKTAFVTKYGLFEFNKMAFGLCNAPATFQRAMQLVLKGLKETLAYLDDIIVTGTSFASHLRNLRGVFMRFREFNLKLKPRKCSLFQQEVAFLGRVVSAKGIAMDPSKVDKVVAWPQPKNVTELQSFLGFVNYHREHVRDFSAKASPLYELTKKGVEYLWTEEHSNSFELLKGAVVSAPVLGYPLPEGQFVLDTDASEFAIGAELSQVQDGKLRVIAYGSYALAPAQRNYCVTRKELLAVVRFTRHFRHYLLGRPFLIRTDHGSLTWLMRFKLIGGQLARWLEELSQYDMTIIHRAGKNHCNADGLSRIPSIDPCKCYNAGAELESLPCGGCSYCQKVHQNWHKFEEEVDDVVPLAVRTVNMNVSQTSDSNNSFQSWTDQYSPAELVRLQAEDTDLEPMIDWLTSGTEPADRALWLSSPIAKELWINRNLLSLSDGGVLHYHWEDSNTESVASLRSRVRLVVPRSLRNEVLQLCHDIPFAGHSCHQLTLDKLRLRFYWPLMSKDCSVYVKSCGVCNRSKKPNVKPRAALGSYHVGAPMERVHLDILGPFPKSSRGNQYVLMLVDQFTKWVECFPLPDQTAESVARTFLDDFIVRHGCPMQVHTDQGTNFVSDLFQSMCKLMAITKTRTTPYRPCSNGQVERLNRTLLQGIRCFLLDKQDKWDEFVPQIAGAIRATINRSTGFTPNFMMLGREVIFPADVIFGTSKSDGDLEPGPYVSALREKLRLAHRLAREKLNSSQEYQKRTYDLKLSQKTYEVGDLVYQLQTTHKAGMSRKLNPVWDGPHLITEVRSPFLYRIRNRRREQVSHHDRLKLYEDRDVPMWIRRLRNQLFSSQGLPPFSTKRKATSSEGGDKVLRDIRHLFDTRKPESVPTVVPSTRAGRIPNRPKHLDDYLD